MFLRQARGQNGKATSAPKQSEYVAVICLRSLFWNNHRVNMAFQNCGSLDFVDVSPPNTNLSL